MLLLGEQDFAAIGHDSFDANALVMVTLRQATSWRDSSRRRALNRQPLKFASHIRNHHVPHRELHAAVKRVYVPE